MIDMAIPDDHDDFSLVEFRWQDNRTTPPTTLRGSLTMEGGVLIWRGNMPIDEAANLFLECIALQTGRELRIRNDG